jgi:hypothetical protein
VRRDAVFSPRVSEQYKSSSCEAFLPFDDLLLYLVNSSSKTISCRYLISPSVHPIHPESPAGLTSLLRSSHLLPLRISGMGQARPLRAALLRFASNFCCRSSAYVSPCHFWTFGRGDLFSEPTKYLVHSGMINEASLRDVQTRSLASPEWHA